ncbi:YcxB family protein [Asanoa sp. NPDC050611]|uniref:YcxB family protein n=1 Tax=Asanoa sp. NPDC050611 TaxID=3157098 RepID=UPI0033E17B1B
MTSDDLVDAIATQRRGVRRGWRVGLFLIPVLIGLAIGLVRSKVWETPAEGLVIIAVACLVIAVFGVGFGLLVFRLVVRPFYRWQARLILRGNPAFAQPVRTTVTDTGIHADNGTGESKSAWSQYPLYAETDRSFVLLASKSLGAMALVLPKRALAGEDAAHLRALLDTHSNRRA